MGQVLSIQNEINSTKRTPDQPDITLINTEELSRIEELIAANTWPDKWDSSEPKGDEMLPDIFRDGSVQPLLFNDDFLFN